MRHTILVLTSGLAVVVGATPTLAQADLFARDRNVAVSQRPRPELQALGLRWGTFMVYPETQLDVGYDDNVTAAETDERSDWLVRLSPSVELESGWSRHSLTAYARAAVTRYLDYDRDNTETWAVGASARGDIQRGSSVQGGFEIARQVEPRTSSSAPQSLAEPIVFDSRSANLRVTHAFNRLRLIGRLDVRDYDYEDGRLINGATINQDDRDQTTYEALGRVDYAVSPATALYGQVAVNTRSFDATGAAGTPNRDSEGINALAGANFELGDLVRGEVGLGYIEQRFDDPLYGSLSGLSTNARLEYFATPLLTLGLTANRAVTDSGIPGSAGILATTVQATADYELRRNILIGARLGFADEEFDGIDRDNQRVFGGVRATYLMNRRFGVTASYDVETRDSSGLQAVNDFTANRFLISLVAQY
jgi:hypothetical protein